MDLNPQCKEALLHYTIMCMSSKFMKLVHAMVHIMKFLEDKRILSTLTFMKPGLCIKCFEHLELVVHMHAQPISIVDNFPYHDAIITWTKDKM